MIPRHKTARSRIGWGCIVSGSLLIASLCAEPRTWKSVSGSTIEARFLGAFGEDYWFEAGEDRRFIKMPSKYISEADLELVDSGAVEGTLPSSLCDSDPGSIHLLEQIYTSPATELPPEVKRLDEAIEQLIAAFQADKEAEAAAIEISFSKRRYKKAPTPETLEKGTVFAVLRQLLAPHELSFQIREGALMIGKH